MKRFLSALNIPAAGVALAVSGWALAEDTLEASAGLDVAEVEIQHDVAELEPIIKPDPVNPVINTAMVFSRQKKGRVLVRCAGYDRHGTLVGRARLWVKGHGVAFLLASDIPTVTPAYRFLGSVKCTSTDSLVPSVYISGHGFTSARSLVLPNWNRNEIYFPLVAVF